MTRDGRIANYRNSQRLRGASTMARPRRNLSNGMGKAINSRQKGARGERELAKVLREYGFEARRGQQFSGANGDADVLGIPGIHIECKNVEHLNLDAAMEQSERDATAEFQKQGRVAVPVVIHKKNRKEWKITMKLRDFLDMFGEVLRNGS